MRPAPGALLKRIEILEQIVNGASYKEIVSTQNICPQRVRAIAGLAVQTIRQAEKSGLSAYEQGVFSAKELRDNREFWLGALRELREEFGLT